MGVKGLTNEYCYVKLCLLICLQLFKIYFQPFKHVFFFSIAIFFFIHDCKDSFISRDVKKTMTHSRKITPLGQLSVQMIMATPV